MPIKRNQNPIKPTEISDQAMTMVHVTPEDLEAFENSIHYQLEALSHDELIQLIQNGHVAINKDSLSQETFDAGNVSIIFAEFGEPLDSLLQEKNMAWIASFLYLHEDIFPTNCAEEWPLGNPRWKDIVAMPCKELISKIHEFMDPMFFDMFQTRFVEFQIEMAETSASYQNL